MKMSDQRASSSHRFHFHSAHSTGSSLSTINSPPSTGSSLSPINSRPRSYLLHGDLHIVIFEAQNLPKMGSFSDLRKRTLDWIGMGHRGEINCGPYVKVVIEEAAVARTFVYSGIGNPCWNQHFIFPVACYTTKMCFNVIYKDVEGRKPIGKASIAVEDIYLGEKLDGLYQLTGEDRKLRPQRSALRLSIQYIPVDKLISYGRGVRPGPDYRGVPGAYFPPRKGGGVTLYQDAHVPDGCLPSLDLDGGLSFEQGKCWRNIYDAINKSRHLVYIAGWSVYHLVRLVREPESSSARTLGELLKDKSGDGVRVLILVWDDPGSGTVGPVKWDLCMKTHDEETRKFFMHSEVRVLLCPRFHSWFKLQINELKYSHHQKTVIVDCDCGDKRRKLVAFVGGLDLTDGRYDTPAHPLFETLQTVHREDFRNPTIKESKNGPRQPWHDMHCRIDGPAVYDILDNFEKRWTKASEYKPLKHLFSHSQENSLLDLSQIPNILSLDDAVELQANEAEAWQVQVFRSIDSNSIEGFPTDLKEAPSKNLVSRKNVAVDMSMHLAYIDAIRAAQHFIYIENQYFIGSSYNWSSSHGKDAVNLIPMEIALKIKRKIEAKERFSAYVVIPMWPEGKPTDISIQRMLCWQHATMQMMYDIIYKALEDARLEKEYTPEDYLVFFCLGNREVASHESGCSTSNPAESHRFMIYVHSKGMIVDDEYVIVGSANINQRSLDGTRDTEIGVGAFQPQHTWSSRQRSPRGQVYGYRMSLWAEHTGLMEDCFSHPESLECIRRVKQLGVMNWGQYVAEEVTEMSGHLLKYPVKVDPAGVVTALDDCETFPDFGGKILGSEQGGSFVRSVIERLKDINKIGFTT